MTAILKAGFPGVSVGKNLSARQETQIHFLGGEDLLEKEIATHCSTLAWEIPCIEEPGGLQSMGSQRVAHDSVTKQHQHPESRVLLLLCNHSFSPTSLFILCSPILAYISII